MPWDLTPKGSFVRESPLLEAGFPDFSGWSFRKWSEGVFSQVSKSFFAPVFHKMDIKYIYILYIVLFIRLYQALIYCRQTMENRIVNDTISLKCVTASS